MELTNVQDIYVFVVHWVEISRGEFLSEGFPSLESCMYYLEQWAYDPKQVKLSCIQIFPE
jgi:hypothetical protein